MDDKDAIDTQHIELESQGGSGAGVADAVCSEWSWYYWKRT